MTIHPTLTEQDVLALRLACDLALAHGMTDGLPEPHLRVKEIVGPPLAAIRTAELAQGVSICLQPARDTIPGVDG